ncbi:16S rRNA (guanine(966)-N(2))-methyltransferase RsmD [Salana multivorans]
MTRIIAGIAGGRTIQVPPRGTRPTSDRVREALFTRLDSYDLLDDARVLDLYAGSGALGLEAASRGAAAVDLVEHDRRAAQVCRDNARTLALPDVEVRVHQAKVEPYLAGIASRPEPERWTLAFVDPPYDLATERLDAALHLLVEHLSPDAVVVVERSSRSEPFHLPDGLETWQDRKYGETTLHFLDRV